jgi:atlastin
MKEMAYTALRGEMSSYLEEVIRDKGESDLQTTRDQIARCFSKVDCYLLPHPGPKVVRKTYSGAIDEMDPFFRTMVCAYTRQVLGGRLPAKLVNGRSITAPELLVFFETYVSLFQEGESTFPKAMTMLEATAQANNRNAVDLSLAQYRRQMGKLGSREGGFVKETVLVSAHDKARTDSFENFEAIATMGAEAGIAKSRSVNPFILA